MGRCVRNRDPSGSGCSLFEMPLADARGSVSSTRHYTMNRPLVSRMRFECQPGCTNCCRQEGFVHVTDGDIGRIAPFLGMSVRAFRRRYVYKTTNRQRLLVPRGSTCHFLTDGGCSIHAVKPVQCRLFPYWPEFIDDSVELRKLAKWCPGIGKGELVQIGAARRIAQEMREAYPRLY